MIIEQNVPQKAHQLLSFMLAEELLGDRFRSKWSKSLNEFFLSWIICHVLRLNEGLQTELNVAAASDQELIADLISGPALTVFHERYNPDEKIMEKIVLNDKGIL